MQADLTSSPWKALQYNNMTSDQETSPSSSTAGSVPAAVTVDSKKRSHERIESTTDHKKPCPQPQITVIDVAAKLGHKAGDRLQVKWYVDHSPEEEATADADAKNQQDDDDNFHWWPATLLEHDGTTVAVEGEPNTFVAVRVLDYEPYPEGGFPERSQESVVFLGAHALANLESEDQLVYRKQGEAYDDEDDEVVMLSDQQMEDYVNGIMSSLLDKHADKFQRLPAADQARIADQVRVGKEKFLEALQQTGKAECITSEKVQELMAKAVSE
jgi:hypothetical protein